MNNLELLHEGFKNELEELESMVQHAEEFTLKRKTNEFTQQISNIISNLEGLCDNLYSEFENSNENEFIELKHNHNELIEFITDKLSYEDKTYLRLKHGIEIY